MVKGYISYKRLHDHHSIDDDHSDHLDFNLGVVFWIDLYRNFFTPTKLKQLHNNCILEIVVRCLPATINVAMFLFPFIGRNFLKFMNF